MYDILLQEESISPNEAELQELKSSLEDTPPVGVIVNSCRTLDQVECVLIALQDLSVEHFFISLNQYCSYYSWVLRDVINVTGDQL